MTQMQNTKRLHVHISVADLNKSIRYYTALFGVDPSRKKEGYVQWRLDDPSVNFAISRSGDGKSAIGHLGIEVNEGAALETLNARLLTADDKPVQEANTTCCYARSDKYWSRDPDNIVWELFHTHADVECLTTWHL